MKPKSYKIFTDGGARGNPGPAAIGFVVIDEDSGETVKSYCEKIGKTTNNIAEYSALVKALIWVKENFSQIIKITFFLDSKLVVNQLNGYYKIKNSNLRLLILKIRELESSIKGEIFYQHIPREENQAADKLVNSCLA